MIDKIKSNWKANSASIENPGFMMPDEEAHVGISNVKGQLIYLSVSSDGARVSLRHLTPEVARHLAQLLIKVADQFEGQPDVR